MNIPIRASPIPLAENRSSTTERKGTVRSTLNLFVIKLKSIGNCLATIFVASVILAPISLFLAICSFANPS
jgi:hypothetical protein